MRVAVIRGDIPAPVRLAGLEPISQFNPDIEPEGQEIGLSRPSDTRLTNALSAVPASFQSTAAVTFPLTINAGNQTLKLRLLSTDAYTSVLVPTGVYADLTSLLAAINTGLSTASFPAIAVAGTVANTVQVKTTGSFGVGARIQVDTTAGGSTFNTPANFAAGGTIFTLASAASIIAATVPVGGPVDVSNATLLPLVGPSLSGTSLASFADLLAPRIYQTSVVEDSLKVGDLSRLLSASYTPNPNLITGAAIAIVQDDGVTAFVPPTLPTLASAVVAGSLTLTGTGLCDPETEEMAVTILGAGATKLYQRTITQAGGTVSATSIVIPAGLIPGVVAASSSVKVQFRSFMSNTQVLAL